MIKSIIESVEKFQKEQRNLYAKLAKITDVCRTKFKNLEQEHVKKNEAYENKFMSVAEDLENLRKEQIKLSDDVTILEAERDNVTEKFNIVDENFNKVKKEIEDRVHDIVNIVNESGKDSNEKDRKQCKFDRKGYCRETEKPLN